MVTIPLLPLHPAYAAGILDGEGSFSLSWRNKGIAGAIRVGMTDAQVPMALHGSFGGTLCLKRLNPARRGKDVTLWDCSGAERCLWVIGQVWPYLISKKPQAAIMVLFTQTVNKHGMNGISEQAAAQRRYLMALMHDANRRGRVAIPFVVSPEIMGAAALVLAQPLVSPEERVAQLRTTILALRARGVPWPQVALEVGYSANGLAGVCRRLGLPHGYADRDISPR